ncbi:SDR family oxidoreductase [Streptomyces sp. HNM0574]|uniref:SDR family NAD(P)-dependent oxidoreductase n=1 Tax=Streptomyces sp. HNM0574 TaxID=2714954 RepID=UPI00146BE87E|nr:SDR family oxidoreductase [Streptomyces sp. HNM0574]NLU68266.1 SDR family oxidoreductase [Streptomyces sp. HNM0574]
MRLAERVALVHGAGGSVGGAVARAFAAEGAVVHLTGRTAEKVAATEREIRRRGGRARSYEVDVTDAEAVRRRTEEVLAEEGRVDILHNAVTYEEVQGAALHTLEPEAVERTLVTATRAHLNTVRAVVPAMTGQGSGVIQTTVGFGPPYPLMGSTAIAWHTVEALYRQFAVELGEFGIRVQRFRTGGYRESVLNAPDYGSSYAGDSTPEDLLAGLEAGTPLHRLPSLDEAGAYAVFAASPDAASLTATAFNLTAGAVPD